jgi:hypothetical protein
MSAPTDHDSQRRDRSAAAARADSLIRRVLRVGDPWNPAEIAEGLTRLYADEKLALLSEASGLPVAREAVRVTTRIESADTATSKEMEQARNDVERDLVALTNHNLLKDIQPELEGWSIAIRRIIQDGLHSAEFALDARKRDNTFAARRSLRDFARLARYIGALTPHLNIYFRRLAQSLDEVGAVLLVIMGEELAEVGVSTTGVLLQAPAGELEERRDAILQTLRTLNGAKHSSHGESEWPRGMVAYRELLSRLDRNGQSDLRALLTEDNMSRLLDDLVDQATVGGARGLRSLAASAQVPLQRLQRLYHAAHRLVEPESPPIAALLSAIRLLLDAFVFGDTASRLIFVARPPVLYYGLYGLASPQDDDRILLDLINVRGSLASALDCVLDCGCAPELVLAQILGDKALYDIDHAIDLFIQGQQAGGGIPECRQRCDGYARLFELLLVGQIPITNRNGVEETRVWAFDDQLKKHITEALNLLNLGEMDQDGKDVAADALCQQLLTEDSWRRLVRVMSPSCREPSGADRVIEALLSAAIGALGHDIEACRDTKVHIPATLETSLENIVSEHSKGVISK